MKNHVYLALAMGLTVWGFAIAHRTGSTTIKPPSLDAATLVGDVQQQRSNADIYVANIRNSTVSRYDGVTGSYKGTFVEAGSGSLQQPTGITFGPDGNLYVSSSRNNRVLRYDGKTGKFLDIFVESDQLQRPFSLIFGPDRNLYVSSGLGAKVLRFDRRNGRLLNIAASGAGLSQPIGIAFGPDRKLYVVNSLAKNVLRFEPDSGKFLGVFAKEGLSFPSDLLFAGDMLYVSNAATGNIARVDAKSGDYRGIIATLPDRGVPMGLALNSKGDLWVGDFGKNRLFRVTLKTGRIELAATEGLSGPENITIRRR